MQMGVHRPVDDGRRSSLLVQRSALEAASSAYRSINQTYHDLQRSQHRLYCEFRISAHRRVRPLRSGDPPLDRKTGVIRQGTWYRRSGKGLGHAVDAYSAGGSAGGKMGKVRRFLHEGDVGAALSTHQLQPVVDCHSVCLHLRRKHLRRMEITRKEWHMRKDMEPVHRIGAGILQLLQDGRKVEILPLNSRDMESLLAYGGIDNVGNSGS